jgi:Na+/melibiose symporter-like transporter
MAPAPAIATLPRKPLMEVKMLAIKACYLYIPALLIVASMLWMGRFYRLDDQYDIFSEV